MTVAAMFIPWMTRSFHLTNHGPLSIIRLMIDESSWRDYLPVLTFIFCISLFLSFLFSVQIACKRLRKKDGIDWNKRGVQEGLVPPKRLDEEKPRENKRKNFEVLTVICVWSPILPSILELEIVYSITKALCILRLIWDHYLFNWRFWARPFWFLVGILLWILNIRQTMVPGTAQTMVEDTELVKDTL